MPGAWSGPTTTSRAEETAAGDPSRVEANGCNSARRPAERPRDLERHAELAVGAALRREVEPRTIGAERRPRDLRTIVTGELQERGDDPSAVAICEQHELQIVAVLGDV